MADEHMTNKIVLTLVLIAMVVSVIGTMVVTNAYDASKSDTDYSSYYGGSGNGGKVKVDVRPSSNGLINLEVRDAS